MASLELQVSLEQQNQITIPDEILRRFGLKPGDRLVMEIDEARPDRVQLRPIRRSYRGILAGVYGTEDEAREYIRAERASWDQ